MYGCIPFVIQVKHSRSSSETHGNSSENMQVTKFKWNTGNSNEIPEIQVKQIFFHYIIFNSIVQFSHYNMPAFLEDLFLHMLKQDYAKRIPMVKISWKFLGF